MMMAYLISYYVIKPFAVNLLGVLLFSGLNFDGTKGSGSKGPAMPVNPASLNLHGAFICDTCTKTFTRSENLLRHRRARHGGALRKDFRCKACQAQFSRSDVYKKHCRRCRAAVSPKQAPRQEISWDSTSQEIAFIPPSVGTSHSEAGHAIAAEALWEDHGTFATRLSQHFLPPSPMAHDSNIEALIKAYFEYFHPSFPLLHRPTFSSSSTPELLLKATAVIGSLFLPEYFDPGEAQARSQWRRDTWESGQQELRHTVSSDLSDIRKPWVMQAWLLYIIYGAYACEAAQFEKAKQMLRQLVDAVRKVGLSQQGITMPDSQSWMYPDINAPTDDSQTLPTRWLSYISAESLRLSLYSLVFLDSHTFSLYNTRPLISPMEFSWELPFPSNLWEAKNPQIWLENFNDYFETSPHRMTDASWHTLRGLSTASLTIATQQIMTETPSPELLIALQASPFATFCLLANLGALLRDFTRCYYQMPSTLSDPNPFHVLTKQQNEQFHMGIQAIAKIVKDQAYTSDNFYSIQGRTIRLFMSSLRINLCRPDELLIGGIVDTNLIDGMIASTYLAQGNFVANRRSAPLTPRHIGGDESILALLNDLCGAISLISLKEPQKWVHEAPWATVASYGILLCVWGALRRTSADIRQHLESFNELPRTSESCMLIFSTLMDSALVNSSVANNNRPWCLDRETFDSLLEEGESLFVSSMRDFCKQRHLWGIGPSMLAVLGEIPTGTNSGPG